MAYQKLKEEIIMNEQNITVSDDMQSDQILSADTNMSVENDSLSVEKQKKRKRAPRKDRSHGKYSQEDFLNLPRDEQYALADKYWNGSTADFDDGTFQFSYPQLGRLCEQVGLRKGIVDTRAKESLLRSQDILYLDRGRREETVEKKYTYSKTTIDKFDELVGPLSNIEKSKVLDLLLSQILEEKLEAKRAGRFHVVYKAVDEEVLI